MRKEVNIEGNKVYLRNTVESDIIKFAEWERMPHVTEFFTISEGRTIDDVKNEIDDRLDDRTQIDLTICLKENDEVIGRIWIAHINYEFDSMDITRIYIGDMSHRGEGLGEDALRCALRFGFEDMGMNRITLDYFTGNTIASSLYRKAGFTDEGVMRQAGKKNGKYYDLNLMSILKSDFFK